MAIGVFGDALHAGELPDPSIEAASALSRPLYWMFEMGQAALNPYRALADAGRLYYRNPVNPLAHTQLGKSAAAWFEMFERVTRRYGKPDWGIDSVTVGATPVPVRVTAAAGSARSAGCCISSGCSSTRRAGRSQSC